MIADVLLDKAVAIMAADHGGGQLKECASAKQNPASRRNWAFVVMKAKADRDWAKLVICTSVAVCTFEPKRNKLDEINMGNS